MRNIREMATLCHILDHLAMGRVGEASDFVAQRLKAVELAAEQGHWDRAKYLELLVDEKVLSLCFVLPPLFLSQTRVRKYRLSVCFLQMTSWGIVHYLGSRRL